MWETLCCEYFCGVKMVLRTELYSRNKILAINGFALSVLVSFIGRPRTCSSLIDGPENFSTHGVHHPAADVDRLYAMCTKGGRGLQQIESTYQSCIVGLDCYLHNSSDLFMQMVQEYDARRSSHSIQCMARQSTGQLQGSLAKNNKSQSLH